MVCFDLKQCLCISLLNEQVFEKKASFWLSPKSNFSVLWLKEEDSPGSPLPTAPGETRGWDCRWGRPVFCLVQVNLGRNAAVWMLLTVKGHESNGCCHVCLCSDLALCVAVLLPVSLSILEGQSWGDHGWCVHRPRASG